MADECVFHSDFKERVNDLEQQVDATNIWKSVTTEKVNRVEMDFRKFKTDFYLRIEKQRADVFSFIMWGLGFGFSVLVFIFGIIQWFLN